MLTLRVCGVLAVSLAASAVAQSHFPPPPAPAGNPVTTEKALLGMALFWDEQLSSSNTIACGTCHVFSAGGVDPRLGSAQVHPGYDGTFGTADDVLGAGGVPVRDAAGRYTGSPHFGIEPQATVRKAPSVINAAYQPSLFYDGRAKRGEFRDPVTNQVLLTGEVALENAIKEPPLNPVEMGHAGRTWTDVAGKIAAARPLALASNLPQRLATFVGNAADYDELFERTYGTGATATPSRIIMAIASYLRTLVSDQTRFDAHLASQGTLTPAELRGLQEFSTAHGNARACVQCHGDLQATSHQFGPTPLMTTMYGFLSAPNSHNTGIRPIVEDAGVGALTALPTDLGRFRVPGLRNTSLHGSWFHNGAIRTLAEVVEFYDRGGDFHVNQAPEIQPMNMTAAQKSDLVAFLNTLVDPRVQSEQAPFDRPRLASENGVAPTVFGSGMVGSANLPPRSMAIEPLAVGGRATIAVQDTVPNTPAFLLWDTVAVPQGFNYGGVQLHLGLYEFALTYAGQTQALASGRGALSFPIGVPPNNALSGFRLYAQWLLVDPAAPIGISSSDAIEMVVR